MQTASPAALGNAQFNSAIGFSPKAVTHSEFPGMEFRNGQFRDCQSYLQSSCEMPWVHPAKQQLHQVVRNCDMQIRALEGDQVAREEMYAQQVFRSERAAHRVNMQCARQLQSQAQPQVHTS